MPPVNVARHLRKRERHSCLPRIIGGSAGSDGFEVRKITGHAWQIRGGKLLTEAHGPVDFPEPPNGPDRLRVLSRFFQSPNFTTRSPPSLLPRIVLDLNPEEDVQKNWQPWRPHT
jgi:hypothetical protein